VCCNTKFGILILKKPEKSPKKISGFFQGFFRAFFGLFSGFFLIRTGVRPILTGGKTDKKATKKQQFVDCFCLRPGRACAILVSVLPIIFVKTKLGFL
jgi:hypothetical protein